MINFLLAFSSQLLLILLGIGLLQWSQYKGNNVLPNMYLLIPMCYTIGTVVMLFVGYVFLHFNILLGFWHWIIVLLTVALWYQLYRTQNLPTFRIAIANRLEPIEWIVIAFVVIKVFLLLSIVATHSVIDSDATYIRGYAPMSKIISSGQSYLEHYFAATDEAISPLGLALFGAFPALFTERWFDFAVAIPWWFAYIAILGSVFSLAMLLQVGRKVALFCVLLFSTIPILANHVARPGFGEIWLTLFLLQLYGVSSLYYFKANLKKTPVDTWIVLSCIASFMGAFFSKSEGQMWALWWLMASFSLWSIYRYDLVASKVLAVKVIVASVVLFIWYNYSTQFIDYKSLGHRGSQLAPILLSKNALLHALNFLWNWSTNGLFMWFSSIALVFALWKGDSKARLYLVYIALIWVALLFMISFTASVKFTLQGTTPARFMMHTFFVGFLFICVAAQNFKKSELWKD